SDNTKLLIFTTPIPTAYRFPTLMHDPKYRLDIAWQNVGYNQPPHPGFFLGEGMAYPPPLPDITVPGGPTSARRHPPGTPLKSGAGKAPLFDLSGRRVEKGRRPSLYILRGDHGGRVLAPMF